jgi:hypothetical protein
MLLFYSAVSVLNILFKIQIVKPFIFDIFAICFYIITELFFLSFQFFLLNIKVFFLLT